jgi:type IV pilus assembly protein PilM
MANIPDFFGLNLGHFSIKIAESKSNGAKSKVLTMGYTPTTVGILDNDSDSGIQTLSNEINKAYKSSNVKTKNCVMSVPEVSVFSRLITLPKVTDTEVGEAIQWALKPLVPLSLEDVNISFLEIDEKVVQGNVFTNWYVVAAPKKLIMKLQDITQKAGLNLIAVETEALAAARMVAYNYPNEKGKDVMILDIGAEGTNVILSRNGIVMFSQIISTGSNSVSKVIAADFAIDLSQAEKYKVAFGMDFANGDGKIAKSIEPIIQIILSEVQRTLTYYKEKIGGGSINTIYLTGGGAALPKLDKYIAEKLSINTLMVDPLINFDVEDKEKYKDLNINGFNVALGLSLKGVL